MSNLKHLNVSELRAARQTTLNYMAQQQARIDASQSIINGQLTRLQWIDKYLFEKTPQELSIEEIEKQLGHKVIIAAVGGGV